MSKRGKTMGYDPLSWITNVLEDSQESEELATLDTKPKRGRPKKLVRNYEKSSQEGLPEQWTRATFIVREDVLKKLKDYAYTERRSIKEIINQVLADFLEDKEVIEKE